MAISTTFINTKCPKDIHPIVYQTITRINEIKSNLLEKIIKELELPLSNDTFKRLTFINQLDTQTFYLDYNTPNQLFLFSITIKGFTYSIKSILEEDDIKKTIDV